MSTQTGIRANDELLSFFSQCKDGCYRLVKVVIESEQLQLGSYAEARQTWEGDWDDCVLDNVRDSEPCFMLYRLDERDGATFRWVLISWSPDSSSIRDKMLYASTKSTLKKEFGGGQIKDDLYGNVRSDISLEGYRAHLVSAAAPGPLSREELEREEVKMAQVNVSVSTNTKHQTLHGVQFPLESDADAACRELVADWSKMSAASAGLNYVQLAIDTGKETIGLEQRARLASAGELQARVPEDKPRYHLYVFRHTHEGDMTQSAVFIYTMPGYSCSIKERMLYSSCRNGLVEHLEGMGLEITKKIEVDVGDAITEQFLYDELHPVKSLNRPKFSKPAPPSRGNRRITKQPVS